MLYLDLFSTINKGVNFRKYLHVYRSIVFIVENTSVDSHYSDNCKIPSYVERIENECLAKAKMTNIYYYTYIEEMHMEMIILVITQ